jgi:hypothetical protein
VSNDLLERIPATAYVFRMDEHMVIAQGRLLIDVQIDDFRSGANPANSKVDLKLRLGESIDEEFRLATFVTAEVLASLTCRKVRRLAGRLSERVPAATAESLCGEASYGTRVLKVSQLLDVKFYPA